MEFKESNLNHQPVIMSAIKFIISILFLIVIAAFSVVNRHSVSVFYYDLHTAKQMMEAPLIVVTLIPFVLGFLLAWTFSLVGQVKSKATIGKRNRTIASLNQDLDRLKSHTKDVESTISADNY